MSRIRILGETKLLRDATCPFCKEIGALKGQVVAIVQDMNTGEQLAQYCCKSCKENVLTK